MNLDESIKTFQKLSFKEKKDRLLAIMSGLRDKNITINRLYNMIMIAQEDRRINIIFNNVYLDFLKYGISLGKQTYKKMSKYIETINKKERMERQNANADDILNNI